MAPRRWREVTVDRPEDRPPETAAGGYRAVRPLVLLVVAVLATLVVHLPALDNGFTNWDDDVYVTANPAIADGTPAGVRRLLATPVLGNYQPLTMLLYALERRLFGLDPRGFHAASLAIHAVNTALVFRVIVLLGAAAPAALAGALLFGIHPLQVESVAWVAEQNNLLSALLLLLALAAYLLSTDHGTHAPRRWRRAALAAYALSLLAKGSGVSFPLLLLLVAGLRRGIDREVLRQLAPFALLALLFAGVNLLTQHLAGATAAAGGYSFLRALATAAYAAVWYLAKLLVPVDLSALYPYPVAAGGALPPRVAAALPLVLAGSACAVVAWRRRQRWAFGLLFLLAGLAPALKVVPLGYAFAADRYVYFPSIGLFFVAGTAIARWWDRAAGRRAFAALLALAFAAGGLSLAAATRLRIAAWHDSVGLWSDVLRTYPGAPVAWGNRAAAHAANGDHRRALEDLDRAFEIAPPTNARAHLLRSRSRRALGLIDGALADLDQAAALEPANPEVFNARGLTHLDAGDLARAREDAARVLALGGAPDPRLPGPGE